MTNEQEAPNYNLSELTSIAVQTVYEATRLSRQGYSELLRKRLEEHEAWTKGWFAEGIAQGLYFHDLKNDNDFEHIHQFLGDDLERICKIAAYVGMGLAIAHTGVFSESLYNTLDPTDRPWVFDGLGFYKLMVSKEPNHSNVGIPECVGSEEERQNAFYAGIGRALWFSVGETQIDKMVKAIDSFPADLRSPIWRGVGFASTYAGGTREALHKLKEKAGKHMDHLQIGCVIAILEQGKEEVPHRQTAAQTYIGKGIGEITKLVSSMGPVTSEDVVLATDATSAIWREKILTALKYRPASR